MKILIANKFYYPRGGDCIYTINLEELLSKHGHDVAVFAMQHPANMYSHWSKYFPSEVKFSSGSGIIEAIRRPFGTSEVKKKFNDLLNDFQPDVVHLNNIHGQISPIIAKIAHENGVRTVWTLHDYKLLCPRYDCLRNGTEICELCFTDKKNVVKNCCMKNSLFVSLLAYLETQKWTKEELERCTDAFICPSQFITNKMIQGGFNKNKIVSLYHFINIGKTKNENYNKEDYFCYLGRLSHEKGIKTMIEAARQLPYQLKIVGSGPLLEELRKSTKNKNIEFLGFKNWGEVKEIVGKARFSVVPSEWYEVFGLVIVEALCLGTPVLGSDIGAIPELITIEKNGILFESRNVENLKEQITKMFNTNFDYAHIASESQNRYSAEHYYNELMNVYR